MAYREQAELDFRWLFLSACDPTVLNLGSVALWCAVAEGMSPLRGRLTGWDIPEEREKAAAVRSCHSLSAMAA